MPVPESVPTPEAATVPEPGGASQTSTLALSVLDLVPVRGNQTSADAVQATVALAQRADELGFTRYWLAEHHNMPSVAATNPPVLIGVVAAQTSRIRVGSGGVMLPNHSPLVVAEQFALLEAAFPGRVDLGLGRAPGSDPVITAFLRQSGPTSEVDKFPDHIRDIRALLDPDGAALRISTGQDYLLKATPRSGSVPDVWLLGSSDYSAQLAAALGLPYVFAHHFAGEGTERALELYRTGFTPSDVLSAPRTFLTANVTVAPTRAEALALALPQLQQMARLRSGQQLTFLDAVEDAARAEVTELQQKMIDRMIERWIIDEPAAAADRLRELAARFGVDEVMVSPSASAYAAEPAPEAPARVRTLEFLAAELLV